MRFKKRKWGWWFVLLQGHGFKVKLIYFKKGGQLSLQKHICRDELWCFISGWGKMMSDTNRRGRFLGKGRTVFIKRGTWHQYKALDKTWVLEIQTGIKCEEIDIERK